MVQFRTLFAATLTLCVANACYVDVDEPSEDEAIATEAQPMGAPECPGSWTNIALLDCVAGSEIVTKDFKGVTCGRCGPPTGGEPCGDKQCGAGQVCCNASCGICTAPDEFCIQIACL